MERAAVPVPTRLHHSRASGRGVFVVCVAHGRDRCSYQVTHGAWGRLWHFMRLAPSKADFKESWQGVDDDGLNCESTLNLDDRLPFKVECPHPIWSVLLVCDAASVLFKPALKLLAREQV